MLDGACFRRLAVLIDGDNISSDHAEHLFAEVTKHGIPWIRRVYGSSSALAGWRSKAESYRIGMHPVQPGKNATDIKLAIHAVEILHRKKVGGYCIVSSDRDFTELVLHLQRADAFVVGLGKSGAAACYRDACHQFVELARSRARKPAAKLVSDKSSKSVVGTTKATKIKVAARAKVPEVEDARRLLVKAAATVRNRGMVSLNELSVAARVLDPTFKPKLYGAPTLKKLLEKCGGFQLHGKGSSLSARVLSPT